MSMPQPSLFNSGCNSAQKVDSEATLKEKSQAQNIEEEKVEKTHQNDEDKENLVP